MLERTLAQLVVQRMGGGGGGAPYFQHVNLIRGGGGGGASFSTRKLDPRSWFVCPVTENTQLTSLSENSPYRIDICFGPPHSITVSFKTGIGR